MLLDLLGQDQVTAVVLGYEQQARGVLVDPVHDTRANLAPDAGQAVQLHHQRVDHRAVRVARGRVHDHTRGLHDHGEIRVLIDHLKRQILGQNLDRLRLIHLECDRLAGVLYTKGLTQEQVSDVFDQIYGQHYSKSSISRMVECVRTQVNEWLERGLEEYYPVVFVDCVHIKIHRKRSVASEAFYVALAVTEEGTREVLGIFNMPQESATGWGDIFDRLKDRGVQRVGLMVADGIKGLDTVIGEKFPGTPLQRCVTHLKRNLFAKVRHGDKAALAADLRDIFRTGQRDYTVETAWAKWQEMCDRWGKDYRAIKLLRNNADYKAYMTYLNYAPEIQAMIYTTNWIERLNRDFRRVTRMRTAMPNEESVLTLMGSVAMDHKAFDRALPNITVDKKLFLD